MTIRGLYWEFATPVSVYVIDPLVDDRWNGLVESHPLASVFHQRGWLEALARTYGYKPCVLTRTPVGGLLADGIVFCRVSSWITGTRLVSLPFSDHCEPLLNDPADLAQFADWLCTERNDQWWNYVEIRPWSGLQNTYGGFEKSSSYWLHELDITPSLERLFGGLHKDCIQRRIRKAERERLEYEVGCSERMVDEFYHLLLVTRRRHQLLPQPRVWLQNLIQCMRGHIQIRMVRKCGIPIAAILALGHQSCVVYKYGCSDERFHGLGAMPFLLWRLIEESKAAGGERIDFGRTDLNNDGLTTFKDRFGATRRRITYFRFPESAKEKSVMTADMTAVRRLLSVLPDVLLPWAGRLVYRHIG